MKAYYDADMQRWYARTSSRRYGAEGRTEVEAVTNLSRVLESALRLGESDPGGSRLLTVPELEEWADHMDALLKASLDAEPDWHFH